MPTLLVSQSSRPVHYMQQTCGRHDVMDMTCDRDDMMDMTWLSEDKCMARNDVWDLGKSTAKSSAVVLLP